MLRAIETNQAYLDQITYQMNIMSHEEQNVKLSGSIALAKTNSTLIMEQCAREGVQLFGGLGYSRGGQGHRVERLYRDTHAFSLGGGSEEVLLDLSIRQAMKMSKL